MGRPDECRGGIGDGEFRTEGDKKGGVERRKKVILSKRIKNERKSTWLGPRKVLSSVRTHL